MSQTNTASPLKWGLTLLLPALVGFTMQSQGFESSVVLFATITTLALCLWAMELLPDVLVAMALPVMYIVAGVGPANRVLGVWSSSVGWLIMGGLIISAFMMKTGFARRLALHCIAITGGSFIRLLWGIVLAGLVLAPFVPSAMGRAAIITVICLSICDALKLEKGSREGAALILAGFVGATSVKMAYLTGGVDQIMGVRLMSEAAKINISWIEYALHNFIPAVIYTALSLLIVLFILRPKVEGNMREMVQAELSKLGAITLAEKKCLSILVVLLGFLLTDRWHGIDVGWVMLLLPMVAFLPGMNILDSEDIKKVNYPVVIFVVGCMTIGGAAMACGVDKILSNALLPLVNGSEMYTVMAVFCAGVLLNFVLTPIAAIATLTVSLTGIATQLGIDPRLIYYSYVYGLDQYIFPYEFAILLYFYASGYIPMKFILQIFSVRIVATFAFVAFVAYPYWKLFV